MTTIADRIKEKLTTPLAKDLTAYRDMIVKLAAGEDIPDDKIRQTMMVVFKNPEDLHRHIDRAGQIQEYHALKAANTKLKPKIDKLEKDGAKFRQEWNQAVAKWEAEVHEPWKQAEAERRAKFNEMQAEYRALVSERDEANREADSLLFDLDKQGAYAQHNRQAEALSQQIGELNRRLNARAIGDDGKWLADPGYVALVKERDVLTAKLDKLVIEHEKRQQSDPTYFDVD